MPGVVGHVYDPPLPVSDGGGERGSSSMFIANSRSAWAAGTLSKKRKKISP